MSLAYLHMLVQWRCSRCSMLQNLIASNFAISNFCLVTFCYFEFRWLELSRNKLLWIFRLDTTKHLPKIQQLSMEKSRKQIRTSMNFVCITFAQYCTCSLCTDRQATPEDPSFICFSFFFYLLQTQIMYNLI